MDNKTIHFWMWELYNRGFSLANYMLSVYDDSMRVIDYTPVNFFTEEEREQDNVKEVIDIIRFILTQELVQKED